MKLRDGFQKNQLAASDHVASINHQHTGNVIPFNAAARGKSVRGQVPADYLGGDQTSPIYSPDFVWTESDCRLFVSALSKLSQKEAESLARRVLL